jgi:putative transposase
VGRKAELIFDPFDLCDIEVRYDGRPMGKAVPVRIAAHTHPKARPETAPAATPTGIDYLSLIAARRDAELAAGRIDYSAIAGRPPGRSLSAGGPGTGGRL